MFCCRNIDIFDYRYCPSSCYIVYVVRSMVPFQYPKKSVFQNTSVSKYFRCILWTCMEE